MRTNGYLDAIRQPCGTQASYKRGCRCPECKTANAAYTKAYRERNADKIRQRKNAYTGANRDREAARARKWYAENTERVAENVKRWKRENRDKHLAHKRNRYGFERSSGAREKSVDVEALWTGFCALCGLHMDRTLERGHRLSPTVDHIVPLSKGGAHTPDNLQWAHMACNSSKGATA